MCPVQTSYLLTTDFTEGLDHMKQIHFQSLCKELEHNPDFSGVIDGLRLLADGVSLFTGTPAADAVSLCLDALSQRGKLKKIGEGIQGIFLKPNDADDDVVTRSEQMRQAYGMLCFTAFFDELDARLPDAIRESIQLTLKDKNHIYQMGLSEINGGSFAEIGFPSLLHGRAVQDAYLKNLYTEMSSRLFQLVQGLVFFDTSQEKVIRIFQDIVNKLPEYALSRFDEQYLNLCSKYPELCAYTHGEWEKFQELQIAERYQGILSIIANVKDSCEAGMMALEQAIIELPNQYKQERIKHIAQTLNTTYHELGKCPLIEKSVKGERLVYPSINAAFIPQAYQLLEYSEEERLELPETWEDQHTHHDMISFWGKYILAPESTDRLLLILGEPGSGKSILTKVLCARLSAMGEVCLRIPLREHDIEQGIEQMVCRQLELDGDASEPISTFKWFAEEFSNKPITLLFDGYDEVLQATGGIYRSMLEEIRSFQRRCWTRHRPVRVIVTSRITLIDKADIPEDTIVMKLMGFDCRQKDRWIEIWNQHNHAVFLNAGLHDFLLPKNKEISELSQQPLLLLMLAIYDANFEFGSNALVQKADQETGLDRTELYDELLRRFIRRELQKGDHQKTREGYLNIPLKNLNPSERTNAEDTEMRRLGIAAVGMLARGKLSLKAEELECDLTYMEEKKTHHTPEGVQTLMDAEALFGSFFFIHKSQVVFQGGKTQTAFEFLHKTFYEFLAADLILYYLMYTANRLRQAEDGKTQEQLTLCHTILSSTYLCAEPELLHMATEWAERRRMRSFHGSSAEFTRIMKNMLDRCISMLREGNFTLFEKEPNWPIGTAPLPQACAVYLMNLLTMQILIKGQLQIEREAWCFISQFLKLNALPIQLMPGKQKEYSTNTFPSDEIILKFMTIFQISHTKDSVILQKRDNPMILDQKRRLETRICLATFTQDEEAVKIYKLHDPNVRPRIRRQYRRELYVQGFDEFKFEFNISQVQEEVLSLNAHNYLMMFVESGTKYLKSAKKDEQSLLAWMMSLYQLAYRTALPVLPGVHRYVDIDEYKMYGETDPFIQWKSLGNVIFNAYLSEKELVLLYIGLLKKVGYGSVLIDGSYIKQAMVHQPEVLPELVGTLLEAGTREFYRPAKYPPIPEVEEYLRNSKNASPRAIAALLRYLYLSEQISESSPIWNDLESRWISFFWIWPTELLDLLQLYLQVGKFRAVQHFFQNVSNQLFFYQLYRYPEAVGGFLDTAQMVEEDIPLCRAFAHHFLENEEIISQYPDAFLRLAYHAASGNLRQDENKFWTKRFLLMYRLGLNLYPVEAVQILIRIFDQGDFEKNTLINACNDSLARFHIILNHSVKTAVQLLIMLMHINEEELNAQVKGFENEFQCRYHLSDYIVQCFRRSVSSCNRDCIPQLGELLSQMNTILKKELTGYFQEQLPFIRVYSKELAHQVEEVCQISKRESLTP